MKHLEESHKQMEDEMDMDVELERELEREADDEEDRALCRALEQCLSPPQLMPKVPSLPSNFTYSESKQPTPSPARLACRRRTMHSQHALLPSSLPKRRASLSPHAFGRRRQESFFDAPALYEEDARFIDADEIEELEPDSPTRRDFYAQNRRQRVDKRYSLRGEDARLLKPMLLSVPTSRQGRTLKRQLSTETAPSDISYTSPLKTSLAQSPNQNLTEEEEIRIVISERRKVEAPKSEAVESVELSERGS